MCGTIFGDVRDNILTQSVVGAWNNTLPGVVGQADTIAEYKKLLGRHMYMLGI